VAHDKREVEPEVLESAVRDHIQRPWRRNRFDVNVIPTIFSVRNFTTLGYMDNSTEKSEFRLLYAAVTLSTLRYD